jgi:hypothetical protein
MALHGQGARRVACVGHGRERAVTDGIGIGGVDLHVWQGTPGIVDVSEAADVGWGDGGADGRRAEVALVDEDEGSDVAHLGVEIEGV